MRTNANITIYNKYLVAGVETYQSTQIPAVVWSSGKAKNTLATGGAISADQATIHIPFARNANYLDPKAWALLSTKTGKWTLQPGDYVVKGLVSDAITITALKAKYDNVLQISSVDTYDGGSLNMQHWQIGAK
jgi:hypothetical protein